MKTPYIALLISLSALLFWQCYEVLYQDTKFLMHEILMKNQPLFSGDDTSTMHDKKYGYFLQITDTHLDDHYIEGATRKSGCHSYPKKHNHFKHHQLCSTMGVPGVRMDAPGILIEHTMDWIRREWRDKLDFVIWTGDNSRHDWDAAHPRKETKVLELNRKVTDMVSNIFCSTPEHPRAIPVVPVIGNNDVQPHNFIGPNDDVLHFFEKLWDHWIPKEQRSSFLKGGYFAVDVTPGLRVLSINTMYFLKANPLARSCTKNDSPGYAHMQWYQHQLEKARQDSVKVYVIGHVPPSLRDFFKTCMMAYMSITADYPDVVFGHFYGHLNMDHFLLYDKREVELHAFEAEEEEPHIQLPFLEDSVHEKSAQDDTVTIQRNVKKYVDWLKNMYNDIDEFEINHPNRHKEQSPFNSEPVVVVHIAPSVFPVYMPTVRIYRYEYRNSAEQGATHDYGTLLGYSQFVANISKYNEDDHRDPRPPLEYELEYDTKTLYGLSDLSVDTYIEFADVLTRDDPHSKQLWNIYCKNMFVQTLNETFDE